MKRWMTALGILLLACGLGAQTWDASKPATSGALVSADIRSNWTALQQSVGTVNLLADPTFLIWPAGDALAPDHWTLAGTGAAIARAGTGLGDTNRKVGDFCAKVTSGAGTLTLAQALLPTAAFTSSSYLKGQDGAGNQTVSAGAWVRTSSGSSVRIYLYDGVGTGYSSYHAGSSTWVWLTATRAVSLTATTLTFGVEVASGGVVGYLSGPTVVLGPVPPAYYQPAPMAYDAVLLQIPGTLTTGTDKARWSPTRPGIVKDVQLWALTAPATTAIIVDVNTWDGAALTSMYSTRPQIAAAANRGSAQPDTTYARRCLSGMFGSTASAGNIVSVDIDQIGTGTVGADLTVQIRYLVYRRPLEEFLAYNDVR